MPVGSFRRREPQADLSTALSLQLPVLSQSPQSPGLPRHVHPLGAAALSHDKPGNNMDSHDGIQRLLAAEQEAQAIVIAARQGEPTRAMERERRCLVRTLRWPV